MCLLYIGDKQTKNNKNKTNQNKTKGPERVTFEKEHCQPEDKRQRQSQGERQAERQEGRAEDHRYN